MLKQIWDFLDNKKTVIGGTMMLMAMIFEKLVGIWMGDSPPDWAPKTIETLYYLGSVFTGVGLSHKGVKNLQKKKTNEAPQ